MHLDFKDKTGIITLDSGHSLILGHKPNKLTLAQVAEKVSTEKQESANLGLFDSSTPNYTTYYPDVTADDLKPKDGDFIYPVFRLLSETTVQKGFKPIDFSKKGVLKKSMNKLLGQTINVDHETALGNAIGSVKEVAWQNAYTTASGQKIPAGINGTFAIDGKSNPRIARGIMMNPPSIHSNSVSVRFKWEQSHSFENDNEFYQRLGETHKDGSMVRVIVTDVVQFTETSLVAHGADPFAQKIGTDGKIVNPEFANGVYSFAADNSKTSMSLDYKDELLSLSADHTIPNELNNNKDKHKQGKNMEFKEFLKSFKPNFELGEDLNEENFTAKLEALVAGKDTEIQALSDDKGDLETQLQTEKDTVTDLTNTIDGNKLKVELAGTVLTSTRNEAKKFYELVKGKDNADAAILSNIETADHTLAESLLSQYKSEAEKLFPDTCQDCNSTNVSKASSLQEDDKDEQNKGAKSNSAVIKELKAKNKKKSIALGN